MSAFLKTSFPIAVAAILTSAAGAQDQGEPKVKSEYCSISKVVGAKVVMNPGAEAKREAEKDGAPAKQPSAKVEDVLVDAETGKLDSAVVSFGGFIGIGDKTVAIPFSAMKWNEAHERFELSASEDRLKALPAFDLGKARKESLDDARNVADSHWRSGARTEEASGPIGETKQVDEKGAYKGDKDVADASGRKPEVKPISGTKFHSLPTRYVAASDLDDYAVYATTEKVGSVSDLFIDRSKSAITLAVVKRGGTLGMGGTQMLVPYRALKLCSSGDEKVLCMNCAPSELETAVVYEKPKHGVVDDEAAKRALAGHTFEKKNETPKVSDNR